MKSKRIRTGYYEVTDDHGTIWLVEHVTPSDGFAYNEWHVGTEDDPHADQYDTKRECLQAIEGFLPMIPKNRAKMIRLLKRNGLAPTGNRGQFDLSPIIFNKIKSLKYETIIQPGYTYIRAMGPIFEGNLVSIGWIEKINSSKQGSAYIIHSHKRGENTRDSDLFLYQRESTPKASTTNNTDKAIAQLMPLKIAIINHYIKGKQSWR